MTTPQMRRAPSPGWLGEGDVHKLENFVAKYGGTLTVHNHKKTIRRW